MLGVQHLAERVQRRLGVVREGRPRCRDDSIAVGIGRVDHGAAEDCEHVA